MDRGVRLFAAAQAFEPIRHVRQLFVSHSRGRKSLVPGQKNVPTFPLLIDIVVVLVIAPLPPRFASADFLLRPC